MVMDPITLKIIWDRLIAITQDAAATMVRTTFSPVVREGQDFCCSLIDINGRQLVEPPNTVPSFAGTLPFTVRHFLRRFPLEELESGDSIVTNDPWLGTGHLNDFNIATPVFDEENRIIAIASSTAHITDVGGTIDFGVTRDVHEEGLRVPITKIVGGGRINEELFEIIANNVRMPDECLGDISGILAANKTMADQLLALIREFKVIDFSEVSSEIQRRSEEAMRQAIDELPTGQYRGSVSIELVGSPITILANITIKDRQVHVDFSGSSPQNSWTSLNVAMNYTYALTVYSLKLMIHPRLPTNDGCLKPFSVFAPAGSILNAPWPAAVFARNYVGHMISAALSSALERAIPDRIWAHSGSAPSGDEYLMGRTASGRPFVYAFTSASGGTGAMPQKDGETCPFPVNGRSTSIETMEQRVPILFERKEIIMDSGGPGKYRGGLGVKWEFRNSGALPVIYSAIVGRLKHPALGLLGGKSGRASHILFNGVRQERGWGRWEVNPNDTFGVELAGGGGLYSPYLRDPACVVSDVSEGFVSHDVAKEVYGVIVGSDGAVMGITDQRKSVNTT